MQNATTKCDTSFEDIRDFLHSATNISAKCDRGHQGEVEGEALRVGEESRLPPGGQEGQQGGGLLGAGDAVAQRAHALLASQAAPQVRPQHRLEQIRWRRPACRLLCSQHPHIFPCNVYNVWGRQKKICPLSICKTEFVFGRAFTAQPLTSDRHRPSERRAGQESPSCVRSLLDTECEVRPGARPGRSRLQAPSCDHEMTAARMESGIGVPVIWVPERAAMTTDPVLKWAVHRAKLGR